MNMQESKSKLLKKIKTGLVTLGVVGTLFYGNSTKTEIEAKKLTYQGYYFVEGKNYLIFDSLPRNLRIKEPQLSIEDNKLAYRNKLEIEKEYNIKYDIPRWDFLFPLKLKKIEETN